MVQVSVIIPAYNGALFLGEAIQSVLSQTYSDYEIIVVDDGSTDDTAQVAKQFGSQVNYLHQANQGVAASRNLGLTAARGDYIAFLDQDDLFLPHKLAAQVALMQQKPPLGIVNSGWQIVDAQGVIKSAVEPWRNIPLLNAAKLIVWKPVFLGAMLFRRSWLERTSGFDGTLSQTPDVDLVMRLAGSGCPAAWLEETTVSYRQHNANASRNVLVQAQELRAITKNFFQQPELPPEIKVLESDSLHQSLVWSAWRLYQSGYLPQMGEFLYESFICGSQYPTAKILDWVTSFQNYSAEYGMTFDVVALTSTSEWQNLIKRCLWSS